MSPAKLARFRALITAKLADLEESDARGAPGQAVVELDQQAVGRLSRMDALQSQAMAVAQQKRRSAQARQLRAALARIDAGEFGWCDDCGEPIALKRLELNPGLTRCIGCAEG